MKYPFTHELTTDGPDGKPVCIAECDGYAEINVMPRARLLPIWFVEDIHLDVLERGATRTIRITGSLYEQVKRALMANQTSIDAAVLALDADDGSDNFEKDA